jgi:integrase
MAQQGYLFLKHGAWYVRYRDNGEQVAHRLASKADYPQKSEVVPLCQDFMAKINRAVKIKGAGATVADFVEGVYFPSVTKRLAASSVNGYRKGWNAHLKSKIGRMRVRDVRPMHIQQVMDTLGDEHGSSLAHDTYKWLKVTLSSIFSEAVRRGLLDNNPVTQRILTPKGRKRGRKTYACSLSEIQQHLAVFSGSDPITISHESGMTYTASVPRKTIRALIGVAAYAGLREGEIRGLWADDDRGDVLVIRRTVWRTFQKDETKTGEDEAEPGAVPIIQQLRDLLNLVKPKHGFIFVGSRGAVLDLENLAYRVIRPHLKAHNLQWHGWHAYRRGLATNLHQLGVDDLTIQAILRHTDVATTRKHYIKTVPQAVNDAMQRLASRLEVM